MLIHNKRHAVMILQKEASLDHSSMNRVYEHFI